MTRRSAALVVVAVGAVVGVGACRRGTTLARDPFAEADSLRIEGRAAAAVPRYRALRDSFASGADSARLWYAELWLADQLRRSGATDSARAALARAHALVGGDAGRDGWTRLVTSIFLDRTGAFDSAMVEARVALGRAREVGDLRLEAGAHNAIARINSLSGRYTSALTANQEELRVRRAIGNPLGVANALNELGIDYRHFGRYGDAVDAYTEALTVYRRRQDPEGIARVLFNLANVRTAIGQREQAVALMTESLHWIESTGDLRGLAFVHGGLGDLYMQAGNLDTARAHFEAARALSERGNFAYSEVTSLQGLGQLELAAGQAPDAVAPLTTARTLADRGGYGRERAVTRASLARAAAALHDRTGALRWARAALALADTLGDPEVRLEALEALAAAEATRGPQAALDTYRDAIALLESVRGRLALGDLRMGVAERHLGVYEGAIRALLAEGRPVDAFDIAEHARAQLLLALLARTGAARQAETREDSVRAQLQERYAAFADATGAVRSGIGRAIDTLTAELVDLDRAARADPTLSVTHPAPQSLAEIRASVLGPGRALLAYFWGEDAVYGWWITTDSIRAARLGSADSLSGLADFLHSALLDPSGRTWRAAASGAYRRLVAPLQPTAEERILVIPDGPLAHVPLEALIPANDSVPWGMRRTVSYGPSAAILAAAARATHDTVWARTLLAVGDPTVKRARERVDSDEHATTRVGAGLGPLPFAAREARSIGDLFQEDGADLLIGREATLARWLALDPGRYRYLHFAAHAVVSDRRPQDTHLVLADGSLDLAAIRRLDLHAQLVTLSACETALGYRVRGEGVIGLPYAFLAAGARGVVVSLWAVGDAPTASFMDDFYGELKRGAEPADALATVRRRYMNRYPPADWAPFVFVGGG